MDKCYKYIRDAAKDRHEDMAEHFVEMSDQFMDHGEDYAAYMNQSVKELEASIKNQVRREHVGRIKTKHMDGQCFSKIFGTEMVFLGIC